MCHLARGNGSLLSSEEPYFLRAFSQSIVIRVFILPATQRMQLSWYAQNQNYRMACIWTLLLLYLIVLMAWFFFAFALLCFAFNFQVCLLGIHEHYYFLSFFKICYPFFSPFLSFVSKIQATFLTSSFH